MAVGGLVLVVLLLLAIVLAIVAVVRRVLNKQDSQGETDGNDILVYLILGIAMGVAGFAMARLAASAFPSRGLVIDPARDLATALPSLIVASPFVVYFWRRQAKRRIEYPQSVGWGVYLSLIQLVFGIAYVTAAVIFLNGIFGPDRIEWTGAVVFAAIVALHELAARRTPPAGDAGEIYRVIGSGIGLFTFGIGAVGLLGAGLFTEVFRAIWSDFPGTTEWLPWLPMTIVGLPYWAYFWLRSSQDKPGLPRQAWTIATASGAMVMALAGGMGSLIVFIQTLMDGRRTQSDPLPFFMAAGVIGLAIWIVHRKPLGKARTNELRTYENVVAAVALASTVLLLVALTQLAFGDQTIVGGDANDVVLAAVGLLGSATSWLWFHTRANTGPPAEEAIAWPRRLYLLGVGAITAIISAIALIATLVVVFQRVVDGVEGGSTSIPAATFVFSGLAAWYLLSLFARSRMLLESKEVIAPFNVTIVCSHPGPVGAMFPDQAHLKVIYRGDDSGVISEELAVTIVESVGHQSSLVWVDGDGIRIAPARAN